VIIRARFCPEQSTRINCLAAGRVFGEGRGEAQGLEPAGVDGLGPLHPGDRCRGQEVLQHEGEVIAFSSVTPLAQDDPLEVEASRRRRTRRRSSAGSSRSSQSRCAYGSSVRGWGLTSWGRGPAAGSEGGGRSCRLQPISQTRPVSWVGARGAFLLLLLAGFSGSGRGRGGRPVRRWFRIRNRGRRWTRDAAWCRLGQGRSR
jgi:hypothetical protein